MTNENAKGKTLRHRSLARLVSGLLFEQQKSKRTSREGSYY